MDDAVAYRRRVWFGVIVVAAFVLLGIAALVPDRTPPSLQVEQASADETLPPADAPTTAAPTTVAPAPSTTSTTAPAPATTSTTAAPRASTTTTTAPARVAAAPAPTPVAVTTPTTAPAPAVPPSAAAFLACVRQRESHGNYRAVSANGVYRGAYQFAQSSWDLTARHAGRNDLVGVLPDQASPSDQDALALALYQWQGAAPWGGACS